MPKTFTVAEIDELHTDAERCAKLAGLTYIHGDEPGLTRVRHGKGFSYRDRHGRTQTDRKLKARIEQLAIPPAWQQVWICPSSKGHILATGLDDRDRKQYLYHPRWRAVRDLLNFYRLIPFAQHLSEIRSFTSQQMRRRTLDRDRVLATMIRIIDLSYVRIGNESYVEDNDSYGLSTLTRRHVKLQGDTISFRFPAKSGRAAEFEVTDRGVARVLAVLAEQQGTRLFSLNKTPIGSDEVNRRLLELTGEHITAKDFRTWGGTLAAFGYLEANLDSDRSAEREAVAAVDQAAEALDNTRSVARAHYVHPELLNSYTEHTLADHLARSTPRRLAGLEPDEQRLAGLLTELFDSEFSLLKR